MSGRPEVIAHTSFAIDTAFLPGPHPSVIQTGVTTGAIRQGTRLYADDPIVVRHPSMFVPADMLPGPAGAPMLTEPSRPPSSRGFTERQIREAVRTARRRWNHTPTRADVAAVLGTTESTLDRAVRDLGMGKWPPPEPED